MKQNNTRLLVGLFFTFLSVTAVVGEDCDKTKCKGPLKFYQELNCKPVYEKPEDCCAARYDCSNVSSRSADKCYANGNEYAVGEDLKDEDRSGPCDVGCKCLQPDQSDIASFVCEPYRCIALPLVPGCYMKHSATKCCGEVACRDIFKMGSYECQVGNATYYESEYFTPDDDSGLICQCLKGYKGENVKPFCLKNRCGTEIRHAKDLRNDCAPVYYPSQSLTTSCSHSFRCQNDNDSVVERSDDDTTKADDTSGGVLNSRIDHLKKIFRKPSSDAMHCKFGNLTMHIGDELHQSADCVRCACEVPPTPTCQRLPYEECTDTE